MESSPISNLKFSPKEMSHYSESFSHLTGDQKKPLSERELFDRQAEVFFKKFKIVGNDLSIVWSLVSEGKSYLRLPNFMAAMRLCSAKVQGLQLSAENFTKEQKVLALKKQNIERPPPEKKPIEETKVLVQDNIPTIKMSILDKIDEESLSNSPREQLVNVENPVLVKDGWLGSSSYYSYTIQTKHNNKFYTVKRRFRDFDWMHNLLQQQYKGYSVPPLPTKRVIQNTSASFVEERRGELERCLNIIAKHPVLSEAVPFIVFTQSSNERFQHEKATAETPPQQQSLELTLDKLVASVQNKMQMVLSKKIMPFSKDMADIEDKTAKLEIPIQTLTGSLCQWTLTSSASLQITESLNIQGLSSKFHALSSNCRCALHNFSQDIKEINLRLEGLKQAITSYKGTIEDYTEMETLINRQLTKHRDSKDEETAAKYLSQIQISQENLTELTNQLGTIEKTINGEFESLNTFAEEKLAQMTADIIKQQTEHFAKEAKLWQEAITSRKL